MLKSLAPFFIIISLLQIIFPKEEKGLISQSEDFEEIDIDLEIEQEYLIKSNTSYIFKITNENYVYSFTALFDNIFYIKTENDIYEVRPNETFFENGEKIYVKFI